MIFPMAVKMKQCDIVEEALDDLCETALEDALMLCAENGFPEKDLNDWLDAREELIKVRNL